MLDTIAFFLDPDQTFETVAFLLFQTECITLKPVLFVLDSMKVYLFSSRPSVLHCRLPFNPDQMFNMVAYLLVSDRTYDIIAYLLDAHRMFDMLAYLLVPDQMYDTVVHILDPDRI